MHLKGSCLCGAVSFEVEAFAPVPYMKCYCSICRKSAGGGGFAINLGAHAGTLKVDGEDNVAVFHAMKDGKESPTERRFCSKCGSALWGFDPRWPDLVHPFASAIDTPLPRAPHHVHIMLGSKADWVQPAIAEGDQVFDAYPDTSLEDWHKRHGLLD
jgi:hypothetical protein